MSEANAFHEFERAGWTDPALVRAYAGGFGDGLTVKVIPALLDAAGVKAGVSLLDVATGPGYVAAAAERGAHVVGVDFAEGMVDEARRRFPRIDFRAGDALDLPFEAASFQAVTINFGLLHFADPQRALAEAFRVLEPGGRVAATVWCGPTDAVGFGMMLDAIQAHGEMNVPLPPGPPFFLLSDHDVFREALATAGFVSAEVRDFDQTWRLPSVEALLDAYYQGTARTGALLRAQQPDRLTAIYDEVRRAAKAYKQPDGSIELPMPCVLAAGQKAA